MLELADRKAGKKDRPGKGVQKTRTAPPPTLEVKGSDAVAPARRTAATARARQGVDGLTKTFLVTIPNAIDVRLERTRVKRGYRSRAQVVVALLDEGAEK